MFEVHAINRLCLRTLAGVRSLAVIDPNDLLTQPDWNTLPNIDALEFKLDKGAYLFVPAIHSTRLEDDPDTSQAGGDIYNYKLTAFVRGIRTDMELFRALTRHRRLHVVATYHDGVQRCLPYMRLTLKSDTGAKSGADKIGYYLTGSATLNKPAPFLAGVFNIVGGGGSTPTSDVDIVTQTTSGSSFTYDIPAGKLLIAAYVSGSAAQDVNIGLTNGGDELGAASLTATAPTNEVNFDVTLYATGITTIFITGLSGSNTIKLWLLG